MIEIGYRPLLFQLRHRNGQHLNEAFVDSHRFEKSKHFATSEFGFAVDVCFLMYESEKSKYFETSEFNDGCE
jgi:hypothetical protein